MGLDEAVHDALAQSPWPALAPAAKVLYYAGATYAWWLLVLLLAVRRRWDLAVPLVLVLVASDGLAFALKDLVARPRPPDQLMPDAEFSFPSGHALRAAAFAGLLAVQRRPRAWVAGAGLFALLMAASRLVLRAHWLTDVLAGLLLGLLVGAAVGLAYQRDVASARTRAEALTARLDARLAGRSEPT